MNPAIFGQQRINSSRGYFSQQVRIYNVIVCDICKADRSKSGRVGRPSSKNRVTLEFRKKRGYYGRVSMAPYLLDRICVDQFLVMQPIHPQKDGAYVLPKNATRLAVNQNICI